MRIPKKFLKLTTFEQIAKDLEDMPYSEPLLISSLDPKELKRFGLDPYNFYTVEKIHFEFQDENNYMVMVGYMTGGCMEARSMDILSKNNLDDCTLRQYGVSEFLKEYYEKYMEKNEGDNIYYYQRCDSKTIEMLEEYFEEE